MKEPNPLISAPKLEKKDSPPDPAKRRTLGLLAKFIGGTLAITRLGLNPLASTKDVSANTLQATDNPDMGEYWWRFDWNKVRKDIENLPGKYDSMKPGALQIVDRLEYGAQNVFPVLDNIYKLHVQRKGSDNQTPELEELTKNQFGPLGSKTTASSEYLAERNIPFLADRRSYLNEFAWFNSAINWAKNGADIIQLDPDKGQKTWVEEVNERLDKLDEKYLHVAAFREDHDFEFAVHTNEPLSEQGEKQHQQDLQAVQEVIKELPWLKKMMVKIVLYSPRRYGHPPSDHVIKKFAGLFEEGYRQGVITLNLDVYNQEISPQTIKDVFIHEVGHLVDPLTNTNLMYFLTPPQLLELIALRQKILLDPDWGRSYLNIEGMFGRPKTVVSQTAQDIRYQAGGYPLSVLANNEYGWKDDDRYTPPYAEFFDPPLAKTMPLPVKPGPYLQFSDFVADNQAYFTTLRNLPVRSVRIIAAKIMESPQHFNDITRLQSYNRQFNIYDKSAEGYWKLIAYALSNAIYLEAFFRNDPGIVNQFTPTEQASISSWLSDMVQRADKEYIAEGIMYGYRLTHNTDARGASNPFDSYLQTAASYLQG